jgi:hypothetical protein
MKMRFIGKQVAVSFLPSHASPPAQAQNGFLGLRGAFFLFPKIPVADERGGGKKWRRVGLRPSLRKNSKNTLQRANRQAPSPLFQKSKHTMGNLKKKRRLKMSKHKRRKRLKSNRHKKRTW